MTKLVEVPDFRLLNGVVSTKIIEATHTASKALTKAKIRHALIGGLAVGAYGYVRATKDVDFLIGDEGFENQGGLVVTLAYGIPIEVGGVAVDVLSDDVVDDELEGPIATEGIPIVSVEALVYLKVKCHRRRDKEDVVELLKAGIDEKDCRQFLQEVAPGLIPKFDALAGLADEEE